MAPGVSAFTHGKHDTLHPILGRADYGHDCFLFPLSPSRSLVVFSVWFLGT